jgi:RNA polymerase sigma-70 factor (ECF subfamily)
MDSAPLAALIAAARAGDHEAFGRLVEAIHYDLRIFVAVRLSDQELVEEVVQAALITAWRVLGRYEGRGSFVSWVKGIALNHLRKQLTARARARAPSHTLDSILAQEDVHALDREDERLDLLRRCLDRLSGGVRRILDLRYREGLDLEALAGRLGKSTGTLAVQFHRVRKTLRTCIEQGGPA